MLTPPYLIFMDAKSLLESSYRKELEAHHAKRLGDPIYLSGFNSEDDVNPHTFPKQIDRFRLGISRKKGPLSDVETTQLLDANRKTNKAPWSRWTDGHDARSYNFLAGGREGDAQDDNGASQTESASEVTQTLAIS